jgi:hypothetical protein
VGAPVAKYACRSRPLSVSVRAVSSSNPDAISGLFSISMSVATYVYCVVRSVRQPSMARVPPGLPGASRPLAVKLDASVWLVTASVPLARYGPGALEASLQDLDSVGSLALAHEGVVEHVAHSRSATVIPMKLFTMFSRIDRAVAAMRARSRELDRVFNRIKGCEEWGVRVTQSDQRPSSRRTSAPRTGAAFLAARSRQRDESRNAIREAAEAADAAFVSLSEIARDRRRRMDEALGGRAPLLDAAFLVPARRRARFHAAAERLAKGVARSGGEMILTGPWPAYNFVGAEDA